MSENIAILAALENEVTPLVGTWRRSRWEVGGMRLVAFEQGHATLLCGGIGPEAGRRAAEALIERLRPALLMSIGLAGALRPGMQIGEVIRPSKVIDSITGAQYTLAGGNGVVVSSAVIAGAAEKTALRDRFPDATAVDMEGAAAAGVAARCGVPCVLVKAISDLADFPMPPLGRFVDAGGRLHLVALAAYVLPRPQWWAAMVRLGRNSSRAARALAAAVAPMVSPHGTKNLKRTSELRVY